MGSMMRKFVIVIRYRDKVQKYSEKINMHEGSACYFLLKYL